MKSSEKKAEKDGKVERIGLLIRTTDDPALFHQIIGVFTRHHAEVSSTTLVERSEEERRIDVEVDLTGPVDPVLADLHSLPGVKAVQIMPSLMKIYGKRIIIIGGGAQVGQVALGAISEADRHNLRGEHISVDTIPLVGEQPLAEAVRAVGRLPRARALVLAGALMGGAITEAVREVKELGIPVISLNMAGSVPDVADLVVTDPVQAGVMTVMAIADTAKFNLRRLKRRVF